MQLPFINSIFSNKMSFMETNKTKTHPGRTDLLGEHKLGDTLQLVFFIVFLSIWIVDSFVLKISTFLSDDISIFIRVAFSFVFFAIAFYFARNGSKVVFGEKREKPEIIKKGVFKLVRHPIYFGAILIYPGFFLLTLSIASFGFWIFVIILYNLIARYEEKLLTNYFGEDYKKYMKEVGRWFPRFSGMR